MPKGRHTGLPLRGARTGRHKVCPYGVLETTRKTGRHKACPYAGCPNHNPGPCRGTPCGCPKGQTRRSAPTGCPKRPEQRAGTRPAPTRDARTTTQALVGAPLVGARKGRHAGLPLQGARNRPNNGQAQGLPLRVARNDPKNGQAQGLPLRGCPKGRHTGLPLRVPDRAAPTARRGRHKACPYAGCPNHNPGPCRGTPCGCPKGQTRRSAPTGCPKQAEKRAGTRPAPTRDARTTTQALVGAPLVGARKGRHRGLPLRGARNDPKNGQTQGLPLRGMPERAGTHVQTQEPGTAPRSPPPLRIRVIPPRLS